jgi:uncharacterized protein with ParB-like and HNH nuclease domain
MGKLPSPQQAAGYSNENKIFRIPDYQRGYSWNEDQLHDFWEDLEYLKDDAFHYTGLLTIQKVDKTEIIKNADKHKSWQDDLWMLEKGYTPYYVIDGQQRLTTVSILIKCILDQFSDDELINYQRKEHLTEKYLYQKLESKSCIYESFMFSYENNDSSDEYFKTRILGRSIFKSDEIKETLYTANLQLAKNFFEGKVEKLAKNYLETLLKKITTQLKFNLFEINDEFDVFVTFETMNNRGKPLSKLELLKNRLIYLTTRIPDSPDDSRILRRYINDVWKTVYVYLGKNKNNLLEEDEFLRNHWMMYFGYNKALEPYSKFLLNDYFIVKNIVTYNSTFKYFIDSSNNERHLIGYKEIDAYINSISKCIKMWYYLSNPSESDFNNEIKDQLHKIQRLGFGASKSLIMCAMVKLSEKQIEEEKMLEFLKLAEKFIFLVFKVTGRQESTEKNNFYKFSYYFYSSEKSIDDIIGHFKWLLNSKNVWNGFDLVRFQQNLKDLFKINKGYYGWEGLRYFLYEYEVELEKLSKENVPKIGWEDVQKKDTIEHIYPQNPKDECWSSNYDSFSSEEKERLRNSLGNLLLLSRSKNSEQQNFCFDYKKKHTNRNGNEVGYFIGSFSEIMVSQYDNWTPNSIFERGIKMLEFMERRCDIKIDKKEELLFLEFLQI